MVAHSVNHTNKWYDADGKVISCQEKIKVMQQNLDELKQIAQDAFEDGILMGIDEQQLRKSFEQIMGQLSNPFTPKNKDV
jgi:regulator of replication initiation timing